MDILINLSPMILIIEKYDIIGKAGAGGVPWHIKAFNLIKGV